MGQLTRHEWEALAAVQGSLLQSQTADQLKSNIRRYFNALNDTVHGIGHGPARFLPPDPSGLIDGQVYRVRETEMRWNASSGYFEPATP